ncbi:MAG: hypothetical protein NTW75_04270 [Planctomycetales bacterium]|nr:hypothetical protein [Planctomycetales bacterium]
MTIAAFNAQSLDGLGELASAFDGWNRNAMLGGELFGCEASVNLTYASLWCSYSAVIFSHLLPVVSPPPQQTHLPGVTELFTQMTAEKS